MPISYLFTRGNLINNIASEMAGFQALISIIT